MSRQLKVPVKQFCGPSNDAIWRAAGPFGSLTLVRKHKVGAGNFWWLTYFPKPTDFKSKREIFTQNLGAQRSKNLIQLHAHRPWEAVTWAIRMAQSTDWANDRSAFDRFFEATRRAVDAVVSTHDKNLDDVLASFVRVRSVG